MVLQLDLERGAWDVVSSLKEVPRLIKDGVGSVPSLVMRWTVATSISEVRVHE